MVDDEATGREEAGQEADAAESESKSRATSVAFGAGRHLASGYAAVRDVRKASRRHSSARTQAKALRNELGADESALEHRGEVEGNYGRIVAEQTRALGQAQKDQTSGRERIDGLEAELATLRAQLAAIRERHEEELRPLRNLVDTTKGRSDAAALALADARRAVKAADGRMAEAVRSRDQRLQAANRTVDGAQGRLHKAEVELERLQADEKASPAMVERMRGEVAAERSAVASAKADVVRVSDDAQLSVDNAQTHLWTQRQSLEVAERQAEAAKHEAAESRNEYDSLYKRARAEEGEIDAAIKDRARAVEAAKAEVAAAERREQEAFDLLAEANDIHATPERTEALRNKVAEGRFELERREQEVSELARQEKGLRKRTRNVRMAFFAALVVVVVVVVVIIWFALSR